VSGTVRKQPVDNHANDREEEDDEAPQQLRGGRGLDFMTSTKTMISRIKITSPRIPPPVPNCQAFPCPVVIRVSSVTGAAMARAARQS